MINNAEFMDDMNLVLGSYLSLTSAVRDEDNKFSTILRSNMTVHLQSDSDSPKPVKDSKRNKRQN